MKKTIIGTLALVAGMSTAFCAESYPSFVDTASNKVHGELPRFAHGLERLSQGADTVLHILHIGDSHIQAEFVTDKLRALLQERYGNAGRGMMPALRLCGTNQSRQYEFVPAAGEPSALGTQTRLLKFPWPAKPGFTGVAFVPRADERINFRIDNAPFTRLDIFTSKGTTTITAPDGHAADSATFTISAGEALYGAFAINGRPGIIYSAIGNNGACYTDYSLIDGFSESTAALHPDLIILSMGTNEGFSIMTDEEIRRSVRNLITTLRNANPGAELLILAPMECQRNRRHGHKPLSPYFDINKRVKEARDIIAAQAAESGVPVWDFYDIAGGCGASDKWLESGLMNKDRIHLLRKGYEVQANLLFDAINELKSQK